MSYLSNSPISIIFLSILLFEIPSALNLNSPSPKRFPSDWNGLITNSPSFKILTEECILLAEARITFPPFLNSTP